MGSWNSCKTEGALYIDWSPQPELTLYTGIVHFQIETPSDGTGLWFLEPLSLYFTNQPLPITVWLYTVQQRLGRRPDTAFWHVVMAVVAMRICYDTMIKLQYGQSVFWVTTLNDAVTMDVVLQIFAQTFRWYFWKYRQRGPKLSLFHEQLTSFHCWNIMRNERAKSWCSDWQKHRLIPGKGR